MLGGVVGETSTFFYLYSELHYWLTIGSKFSLIKITGYMKVDVFEDMDMAIQLAVQIAHFKVHKGTGP